MNILLNCKYSIYLINSWLLAGYAKCPIVDPPMYPEPCPKDVEDKCFDDNDCKEDSSGNPTHCCHYSHCGGKTCGPQPPGL